MRIFLVAPPFAMLGRTDSNRELSGLFRPQISTLPAAPQSRQQTLAHRGQQPPSSLCLRASSSPAVAGNCRISPKFFTINLLV